METILKCYFDNVFVELSRSSLLSWQKRRELTEYFGTVIEACASAGECTEEEGCRMAVAAAIAYHDQSKSGNSAVCLLGKFHNVLYLAVKLCYDYRLSDTELVARLLRDIFTCEGTFERIFAGALFGVRVCHFIAGWKSDFKDQEENIMALAYFLEHATKAQMLFQIGDHMRRLLDVPMTSVSNASPLQLAVQIPRTDLVLFFLQLGSAVKFAPGDSFCSSPLGPLLRQLSEGDFYPPQSLDCLKVLLRAFPSVASLQTQAETFEDEDKVYLDGKLIIDNIVPLSRCGGTPPELKHLCRCAIREVLYLRWKLPFGIYELPIPTSLMKYINLLED